MPDSDSRVHSQALPVPRGAILQTWSGHDWSSGVDVTTLSALDRLTVTTRNSVYEIVVVSSGSPEVMVKGGVFFPTFAPARLCGSSLGGSFLKLHMICPGLCLEIVRGGTESGVIVTTRVRSIVVSSAARAINESVM